MLGGNQEGARGEEEDVSPLKGMMVVIGRDAIETPISLDRSYICVRHVGQTRANNASR